MRQPLGWFHRWDHLNAVMPATRRAAIARYLSLIARLHVHLPLMGGKRAHAAIGASIHPSIANRAVVDRLGGCHRLPVLPAFAKFVRHRWPPALRTVQDAI